MTCSLLRNVILFQIHSYTDTELYEEAVRDYEQIYKMAKTRGNYKYQFSFMLTYKAMRSFEFLFWL